LEMKRFFVIVVCLIFAGAAGRAELPVSDKTEKGALEVEITGFKSEAGKAGILVFRGAEGFPEEISKAYTGAGIAIEDGKVSAVFYDVEYGVYAVSVVHDVNENNRLDKGLFGIPVEDYGFSNNAKPGLFGPPSFESASFKFDAEHKTIRIKIR